MNYSLSYAIVNFKNGGPEHNREIGENPILPPQR